jgi:hypothetical protein
MIETAFCLKIRGSRMIQTHIHIHVFDFTYSGNMFDIALTVRESGRINFIVPDFPTQNIKVALPWLSLTYL